MRAFSCKKNCRRKHWKGSVFVEAAVVFPIIIIVLMMLLKNGITLCKKTEETITKDTEYAEEMREPLLSAEDILREKWLAGKRIFGND